MYTILIAAPLWHHEWKSSNIRGMLIIGRSLHVHYTDSHPTACMHTIQHTDSHPTACMHTIQHTDSHPTVCMHTIQHTDSHPTACMHTIQHTDSHPTPCTCLISPYIYIYIYITAICIHVEYNRSLTYSNLLCNSVLRMPICPVPF